MLEAGQTLVPGQEKAVAQWKEELSWTEGDLEPGTRPQEGRSGSANNGMSLPITIHKLHLKYPNQGGKKFKAPEHSCLRTRTKGFLKWVSELVSNRI